MDKQKAVMFWPKCFFSGLLGTGNIATVNNLATKVRYESKYPVRPGGQWASLAGTQCEIYVSIYLA